MRFLLSSLLSLLLTDPLGAPMVKPGPPPPDTVSAFLILTSPPDSPIPVITPEQWPKIQAGCRQTTIELQILSERESDRFFRELSSWAYDVAYSRRVYDDIKDTPRIEDAERFFVDRATIAEWAGMNSQYMTYLRNMEATNEDRKELIKAVIAENVWCQKCLGALYEVKCEGYMLCIKRQGLAKLKELLGDEAYMMGEIPPWAPFWRFPGQ